ncbi:hypothetical protein EDEG_03794 [Edhazardia aedis USNM 41457]|uniref:Uncharacterized protein n=1 Tax=Edhazardia aedis (strain USNM 41457) TaxID=1003232 RepID=J9DJY4_EDHAE|nr:hypothetical protein EDEG_03794 [Edhazardia aedis USNM 41457]|eukprot:EJW01662.1 hypothetical protein EDEG_03794 [Edhazardia aedis USNM 41457]
MSNEKALKKCWLGTLVFLAIILEYYTQIMQNMFKYLVLSRESLSPTTEIFSIGIELVILPLLAIGSLICFMCRYIIARKPYKNQFIDIFYFYVISQGQISVFVLFVCGIFLDFPYPLCYFTKKSEIYTEERTSAFLAGFLLQTYTINAIIYFSIYYIRKLISLHNIHSIKGVFQLNKQSIIWWLKPLFFTTAHLFCHYISIFKYKGGQNNVVPHSASYFRSLFLSMLLSAGSLMLLYLIYSIHRILSAMFFYRGNEGTRPITTFGLTSLF